MHEKILSVLLLSVIVNTSVCAADVIQITDTKSRADALLAENKKPGGPGCAAGVYENGNTLYEGAYGSANLEHSVPIDPQKTIFDIGSVSKQFTAASILLLVQDGKLKLDDDIRKYLPEIPDYGHIITIEHLLYHTSGVRDYTVLRWMMGKSFWDYTTEKDGLNLISQQDALDYDPGKKHSYSNTGYFLASVIVKRVSGKTLAEFAKQRIFSPLKMNNTYFLDSQDVVPHHASGYGFDDAKKTFQRLRNGWSEYGDGGLQSTIADLAKWQQNFDEPVVGGAWLIEQLQKKGKLNNGETIEYARGLEVYNNGHRGLLTVLHTGGTADGYRSYLGRFPNERLSIAVLCNSNYADAWKLGDQLADIYMEGKFPTPKQEASPQTPQPSAKSSVSLKKVSPALLGTFWNREDMAVRRIERSAGKLWYVRGPESRSELAPIEGGQLQMLGVSTKVLIKPMPEENGQQIVHVIGQTKSILQKVAPPVTDANTLAEYAGTYTNAGLNGARWTFVVKDGKLTLPPLPEGLETLVPAFKDAFFDDDGEILVVFQRDASGRVTSLLVDTVRVRNMMFQRVMQ